MKDSGKLLNSIYKGTDMGVSTINDFLENINTSEDFKKQVAHQANEYRDINREAGVLLQTQGYKPHGVSATAKKMSNISIKNNVNESENIAHYAEMMIKGSTMGINKIAKSIRSNSQVSDNERALAEKLLATEQHNIEQLIRFL